MITEEFETKRAGNFFLLTIYCKFSDFLNIFTAWLYLFISVAATPRAQLRKEF